MKTIDIESLVAELFEPRKNLIVPNVGRGFGTHECDILIINRSLYATEVEIKISASDLKKDFDKAHGHNSEKIKYFFYAVPESLRDLCFKLAPPHAGIIICKTRTWAVWDGVNPQRDQSYNKAEVERQATARAHARKLTAAEVLNVSHQGTRRIWTMKRSLSDMLSNLNSLKAKHKLYEKNNNRD